MPDSNIEFTISLEYLSNFWRFHDLPLINSETELDLPWTKDYVLSERHDKIRLYVSVLTLSINNHIKVSENIKQEVKRTISWNKYRSEITIQQKNKNLDYLIDPASRNTNSLFVLSLKNGNKDPTRSIN